MLRISTLFLAKYLVFRRIILPVSKYTLYLSCNIKLYAMTKVKYIRVSTEEQNTGRQELNAKEFTKIYIDKTSGSIKFTERKEAKKLISDIEAGSVKEIHIASIDRLGRNIIDILTMVEFFNEQSIRLFVENIGMYSLIDNKPNPSFKMIISVSVTLPKWNA